MKYIRKFQSGAGGSDPRNKWYAVYKCAACGHDEWVRISNVQTFIPRDRACPQCGVMDPEDLRKNLELKRASLEAQEAQVRAEIEKVIEELNRLQEEKA